MVKKAGIILLSIIVASAIAIFIAPAIATKPRTIDITIKTADGKPFTDGYIIGDIIGYNLGTKALDSHGRVQFTVPSEAVYNSYQHVYLYVYNNDDTFLKQYSDTVTPRFSAKITIHLST